MAGEFTRVLSGPRLKVPNGCWTHYIAPKYRGQRTKNNKRPICADGNVIADLPFRENPMNLYRGTGRDNWLPFGQTYYFMPGTGDQAQRLREQKQDKTDAEALFPAVVMDPIL